MRVKLMILGIKKIFPWNRPFCLMCKMLNAHFKFYLFIINSGYVMANKLCSSRWSVVSTEDQFRIPEYLLRFHLIPARVFTYGRTDRHHEAFPYDSLSYFRRKVKRTRKRQWQEKIFMEDCQTFRSIYFYTYPFCSNNLGMHIRSTERSQTTGLFRIYFPL